MRTLFVIFILAYFFNETLGDGSLGRTCFYIVNKSIHKKVLPINQKELKSIIKQALISGSYEKSFEVILSHKDKYSYQIFCEARDNRVEYQFYINDISNNEQKLINIFGEVHLVAGEYIYQVHDNSDYIIIFFKPKLNQ